MEKINIRLGLFLLLNFHFLLFAYSQVNFIFMPDVHGKTINGLSMCQIQNLSTAVLTGNMHITVRDNNHGSVLVSIHIPHVTLRPGNNNLPATAFSNAALSFAKTTTGNILSQTRNFPAGMYTYCFQFIDSDKDIDDTESCFDAEVRPLVPVTLIYPDDRDTICAYRPQLSWRPPIPFDRSMRFRLLLTEKTREATIENLLTNNPLVLQDNIPSSTISFPAASADLKEGKTYCWQVIAHQNGMIVSQSEPWEFTVNCVEKAPPAFNDSYRELKQIVNGNYYVAYNYFKFSFINNYNITKLNYAIYSDDDMQPLKRLPEIKLKPGLNRIDIDLTDSELQTDHYYILKVYTYNEPEIAVRFVYKE